MTAYTSKFEQLSDSLVASLMGKGLIVLRPIAQGKTPRYSVVPNKQSKENIMNFRKVIEGYIEAAFWVNENPKAEGAELAPQTLALVTKDVTEFCNNNLKLIEVSGLQDAQVGHDFWLTRNGYGAGFWDRGLGDIGDKLTDAAKKYREISMVIGDDGLIYLE